MLTWAVLAPGAGPDLQIVDDFLDPVDPKSMTLRVDALPESRHPTVEVHDSGELSDVPGSFAVKFGWPKTRSGGEFHCVGAEARGDEKTERETGGSMAPHKFEVLHAAHRFDKIKTTRQDVKGIRKVNWVPATELLSHQSVPL